MRINSNGKKAIYLKAVKLASLETLIQGFLIVLMINILESTNLSMIHVESSNLRSNIETGIFVTFLVLISLLIINITFQLPFILKLIPSKNKFFFILLYSIMESIAFFLLLGLFLNAFSMLYIMTLSFDGFTKLMVSLLVILILSNYVNSIYLK